MTTIQERVTQLKAEGNSFFNTKEYACAIAKYSAALRLDENNSVIYANRSACHLALGRYADARQDAHKATKVDPRYAKGFARLAAALDAMCRPSEGAEAWQRALDALPQEDTSPAVAKQRELYSTNLIAAKTTLRAKEENPMSDAISFPTEDVKNTPWSMAENLLPELREKGEMNSSAWVISAAAKDFLRGVDLMSDQKTIQRPEGPVILGALGAIEAMSDGILRDIRAFYADITFLDLFANQALVEMSHFKAYGELSSAEEVIDQAKVRLSQESWDTVRPALSLTVRMWFLRGFLIRNFNARPDVGLDSVRRAVEVVKLGRSVWCDVDPDERGVIFDDHFFWGLRLIYLDFLGAARLNEPERFTNDALDREADCLLQDMANAGHTPCSRQPTDPGYALSFHSYIIGQVLALKASVQGFRGTLAESTAGYEDLAKPLMLQASATYFQAANNFPPDDEKHAMFLDCALDYAFRAGAPLKVTLPMMRMVREALPKMQKIWANSLLAKEGRHSEMAKPLVAEDEAMDQLSKGIIGIDDPFCPSYVS